VIDWADPRAPELRRTNVARLEGCGRCGSYQPCECDDERAGRGYRTVTQDEDGMYSFGEPAQARASAPAGGHVCPCGLCPHARERGGQPLGSCAFCGGTRYALRCGHEGLGGGGRLAARSLPALEPPPWWLELMEDPCPPGCRICARLEVAGL
jgi:hypothetical protein